MPKRRLIKVPAIFNPAEIVEARDPDDDYMEEIWINPVMVDYIVQHPDDDDNCLIAVGSNLFECGVSMDRLAAWVNEAMGHVT